MPAKKNTPDPKNMPCDELKCDENAPALTRVQLDHVSGIFRAMSETTRLLILRMLKAGPRSVGELVELLDTSQANISRQLKILHDSHLLAREKKGNKVIYSISEPMVLEMCNLVCEKLNRDISQSDETHFEM